MGKTIFGIEVKEFEKFGKGKEGVVYKGPNNTLLKVYRDAGRCVSEYKTLKNMEDSSYFPKVYKCKSNYMLREYVEGTLLVDYIKEKGVSKTLARNLIDLGELFYNTTYLKVDGIDKHVFVLHDESLKVIDPRRKKYRFHKSLLRILKTLKQEDNYLRILVNERPDLAEEWYGDEKISFEDYKEYSREKPLEQDRIEEEKSLDEEETTSKLKKLFKSINGKK